jgi:cysteine desulfurase/selenocysteine lyase
VAYTFGRKFIQEGDEIVVTEMDHHSNIVPWQMLCEEKKCVLKYIPLQQDGSIRLEDAEQLITPKTKLVSVTYVSNALGTINPIQELIALAHKNGAKILIDAAQAIQHFTIDVQALNCDFLVFSGHKIYGPTGTGILYGKEDILNAMPPFEGGGDMIKTVSFKGTEFNDLPFKFEAGTPNIAGCIALGTAIEYVQQLGLENIRQYETELLDYATAQLSQIEGLKIYGTAAHKSSVISFLLDGIHPYDVGVILDNMGIAIRTGHHCAQPVMDHFGIPGTCRATFAFYNTKEEVDALVAGILKAKKMLS